MRFKKGLIDIANNDIKVKKGSMGALIWLFIFCKTNLKKKLFFEKIFVFYKIYITCRKNVFIWKKKSFILKIKNICISFEKYIFMQKMFVLQIKYKSFLNIYSFCKKIFFDHKKYIC